MKRGAVGRVDRVTRGCSMGSFGQRTVKVLKTGATKAEKLTSDIRTGWRLAYSNGPIKR